MKIRSVSSQMRWRSGDWLPSTVAHAMSLPSWGTRAQRPGPPDGSLVARVTISPCDRITHGRCKEMRIGSSLAELPDERPDEGSFVDIGNKFRRCVSKLVLPVHCAFPLCVFAFCADCNSATRVRRRTPAGDVAVGHTILQNFLYRNCSHTSRKLSSAVLLFQPPSP
jgi:hypothetical protein